MTRQQCFFNALRFSISKILLGKLGTQGDFNTLDECDLRYLVDTATCRAQRSAATNLSEGGQYGMVLGTVAAIFEKASLFVEIGT